MTKFALLLILIFALQLAAQTTAFTYQGSLNTGGTPANGNHDFEFELFDAVGGGTQLGSTLTRTNVAVTNGLFAVTLDFGTQFPGANRFLEIRVRTSGGGAFTPLAPRQAVNSSPYAINAAQLGGISASSYATNIGGVINAATQYNIGGQRFLSVSAGSTSVGQNAGTVNTGIFNTFVGNSAGQANTSGTVNTFVGTGAGQTNTTGFQNSFFGGASGSNNTTGSNNSFFGSRAGGSNTEGTRNSFFGQSSGFSNVTGVDNAYFGHIAGTLSTGSQNAFFGSQAGNRNTTGNNNSFFGALAGDDTTTGSDNSFFGAEVGRMNTVGFDNSFFGRFTGFRNTTGNQNSFFGAAAGIDVTTGNGNSFFGLAAGSDVITGSRNSFFGYGTGNGHDSGTFTSAFGAGATAADGLTNATAIGARAMATQNNSLVLGAIDGVNNAPADTNVGIGTTAPARRLHVASGASGATSLSSSDFVIEDDTSAFQHFLTPNDIESGILFGDVTDTVAGGIIFNNAATNNGIQFRAGGNTTRMTLDGSGNLGIGTSAPINRLTIGQPETPLLSGSVGIFNAGGTFMTVRDTSNNIEGIVGADSNGVLFGSMTNSFVRIRTGNSDRLIFDNGGNAIFTGILNMDSFAVANTLDTGGATPICRNASNRLSTCSSSLRYKSNIRDFVSGLSLIKRLRPVSFNWKEGNSVLDLGLVAEEVAKVDPLLTTTNAAGQVEGVKYDRVGVVLVNAVKEQQAQIESQQKQIEGQKIMLDQQQDLLVMQQAEMKRLQQALEALKKLVCSNNREAELCRAK